MNLEVIILPVSDVDRAKQFYENAGWRLDVDATINDDVRLIQFTPPGSGCSIQFGSSLSTVAPGSSQGTVLTVADVQAARAELAGRGVSISEVYHCQTSFVCRLREADGVFARADGPSPDRATYGSFASFSDPEGNSWVLQEVTTRAPGRVEEAATTFTSVGDVASALRRAAAAHGEHEARTGQEDANWPDWYAAYIVAEQAGAELPK